MKTQTMTGFELGGGGFDNRKPAPALHFGDLLKRTTFLWSFFIMDAFTMDANLLRHSEKPENQAGLLRRFSDYSESQTRGSSTMRLRLGDRNDGGSCLLPPRLDSAEQKQLSIVFARGKEGVGSYHFPNRISNLVELGKKFCLPQSEKARLLPHPTADLRTDGAKRIRIASRLSRLEQSSLGETLGAWSKFKTGEGARRAGEGAVKAAFTLAEVLITLGIIGIVAAMTMPSILHKKNSKELEVAFKKAYSNLSNAFNLVLADGYTVFDSSQLVQYDSEFARQVYSKYIKLTIISTEQRKEYNKSAKNFTKSKPMGIPQCSQYMGAAGAFITPDGSTLSIVQNCWQLWFTIDTNGIKKGPNALGHDIFIFYSNNETKKLRPATSESELKCDENGENCTYNNTEETRDKCSKTSKSDINGATCAAFALKNECPWDSTRTYWECLP